MTLSSGTTDEGRTRMVFPPRDFKSLASANSATVAYLFVSSCDIF